MVSCTLCLVLFLSLLEPIDKNYLGSKDLVKMITDACVWVLGIIPMTYERGTVLTHIKGQVSYTKYLGCKVACIWQ